MTFEELRPGLWRWTAGELSSVYYESSDALVLVDPAVPDDEPDRFFGALDRDVERLGLPVVIALTSADRRSADLLAARYGAHVGGQLPEGVEAPAGAVWLPQHRALVVGGPVGPEVLDLPVDLLLPSRGEPVRENAREAVQAAVDA